MNKLVPIALLVGGVVLMFLGSTHELVRLRRVAVLYWITD